MDLISPGEFVQACIGIEKAKSDDGTFYIYKKDFKAKNGETVAMITHDDFSISRKSKELQKKLKKKGGIGLTVNDIVKIVRMNYIIVDQVIEKALNNGKIAVDEQDPAGKRYYFNKIQDFDIEDIEI